MDRIQIVQDILNKLGGKTYLEIGSSEGISFFPINAKRKFAVDISFRIKPKERLRRRALAALKLKDERFFEVASDDFFSERSNLFKKNKIDVALIDGAHTYKQSLRDVLNSLSYLSDRGVIVMHDCNPGSETMAYPAQSIQEVEKLKLPGYEGLWCGDVWKTIVYLRSLRKDLKIFVLDCDFGIGIITRGTQKNGLNYSAKAIESMSYRDLELKRSELLNLNPQNFLKEFLESI